jgi:tetratricopeptide (TPR) repeat protein
MGNKAFLMPAAIDNKKNVFTPYLYLIAVLIMAIAVFLPSLQNGFTAWDDPDNVVGNTYIREFSLANIYAWFTQPLLAMYTPFVYLSYAIDYKIGELNPFIYHLHNLLLHLVNIALVFYAVKLLSRRLEAAVITAVLFAVHPLNVAAVAPVSTRGTLLYSLFFLGSYIAYIHYIQKDERKQHYYAVSITLYLFSALSKSAAVVLPLLLLATDYYAKRLRTPDGKLDSQIIREKLPFFAVSIVFGIITLLVREDSGTIWSPHTYSFFERPFLIFYSLSFYIYRLFFPFNLSAYYPYPDNASGYLPLQYYLSPLFILLILFIVWKSGGLRRVFVFGLLLYLINIALVLKIVPVGHENVCDRYAYLPYVGLFFIIGQLFCYVKYNGFGISAVRLQGKIIATVILAIISLYVIFYSVVSYNRNFVWKDTFTLYKDMLDKNPSSAFVYNQIGVAKANLHDYKGAIEEYSMAIQHDKKNFRAHFNRAKVKETLNDYAGAIEDYNSILAIKPSYEVYISRGSAKTLLEDYKGAISDFDRAVEMGIKDSKAYLNRGALKAALKDFKGALADLDTAVEIDPKDADAYVNRGNVRATAGDVRFAMLDFNKAIDLNPRHPGAYLNRGIVRLSLKDGRACDDWRKALDLGEKQAGELLSQYCKIR